MDQVSRRKPGLGNATRSALRGIVAVAALALAGCSHAPTNFSQFPGFADYFAAHPRKSSVPNGADQALLQRFRPRFMLPSGHAGMIDFYGDYIAHGKLYAADGSMLTDAVTPALLNRHRTDPKVVFVHEPRARRHDNATVYGRVDREEMMIGETKQELTFLTYHTVFRHSGLPAGVAGWRAGLLALVADLNDWHQLDHYTAATLVLDAKSNPLALMLQQHNYTRTYLVGAEVLLDGQRPVIDVALRSNELYPHHPTRTQRRAVRFLTPEAMRYLLGAGPPPRVSGDDITEGGADVEYSLAFLPPQDAFYSFAGFLGERRRLPGRDGPPGADFNTWPTLKPLTTQLVAGFFREGNHGDHARFEATFAKTGEMLDFVRVQAPLLGGLLACTALGTAQTAAAERASTRATTTAQLQQSPSECARGHPAPASAID